MSEYPKQVVIESPLREFMEHCQVYCTAACCEKLAFEIHSALLLRKKIDDNLSGKDGARRLRQAWEQLKDITTIINGENLETVHGQVPVWDGPHEHLPAYWLERDGLTEWFQKWNSAFSEALNVENHG